MLSMQDHIDGTFHSPIDGGVWLLKPGTEGGYTGPGGTWEDGATPDPVEIQRVNVQPAGLKTMQILTGMGGTTNPQDVRVIHINDGKTYLYPDDSGKFSDLLEFSDGLSMRKWRVMQCDNRPWRNFCRAIVERYRQPT